MKPEKTKAGMTVSAIDISIAATWVLVTVETSNPMLTVQST
jgi:hypothetical protein